MKIVEALKIGFRRRLICWVLRRRQWKLAKAYNRVAANLLLSEHHELGEKIRELGDRQWEKVYADFVKVYANFE
jgi:hypothetical protein